MIGHLCTTKLQASGRDLVHPAMGCVGVQGCPTLCLPALRWEGKRSYYPLPQSENVGCTMEDLIFSGLVSSVSSPWQAGAGNGLQVHGAVLTSALLKLEAMSCPSGWFSD